MRALPASAGPPASPAPRGPRASCPALVGIALLAVVLDLLVPGCVEPPYRDKVTYEGGALFLAKGDKFFIDTGSGWKDFFAKGVNLAVATPGKYPGELNLSRSDYDRWLKYMADMHCNTVRLYTLHHPVFYEALGAWNRDHPAQPIYLIQGIWLDEFDDGDIISDGTNQLDEEIRYVVDAVHGQADIPHRYGKAYGKYRHDVSRWVMSWLPGHEMLGEQVDLSNKVWSAYGKYDGIYISSPQGMPIEAWVARALDHVVWYELDKYGQQRPVGFANWPTLDPMRHPYETDRFNQDLVSPDFGRFKVKAPYQAGIFVSYHVYPFYPEFIIYEPKYTSTIDFRGKANNYYGYLKDLKANHMGVPLIITEFGVPSSMGVAHVNTLSYNHGGYSEAQQATAVANLYLDIVKSGAAGATVFELHDEWFKSSWMNKPTTQPADQGRLWHDFNDPEENFGLVAHDPIPSLSKEIDGKGTDWTDPQQRLVAQSGVAVAPSGDGKDFARTIRAVHVASDMAFLYLRIDVNTTGLPDLASTVWYIGLSTMDGLSGDQRFPALGVKAPGQHGLESVVVLDQTGNSMEVLTDAAYDPTPRLNGLTKLGGLPTPNDKGLFNRPSLIINNDEQYKLAGKGFVPPMKYFYPGALRMGDQSTDTITNLQVGAGGIIELRIPWQTLWVADPSARRVLFDNPYTDAIDTAETSGITVMVLAAARTASGLQLVDAAPRSSFSNSTFSATGLPVYSWNKWTTVTGSQERLKPAYFMMQSAFKATP